MKAQGAGLLCLLASLASARSIKLPKRDTVLDIQLASDDSVAEPVVKASVTNTGTTDLNFLNLGTLLDTSKPVEKLSIFAANYTPTFTGIRYRIRTSGLTEDAFTPIAAGETIELAINAAEVHDLTSGGTFDVLSQGVIAYAEAGSTEISGRAFYQSNTVSLNVDGAVAARSARPINLDLLKRTDLQSDCTGNNLQEIRSALSSCSSLATAAANAVGTSAAFANYFHTTSTSARNTAAARLRAVASECASTTSGATDTYCTDVLGGCASNVLAYTSPSQNLVVACPLDFTDPITTRTCTAQSQDTTILHEYTHAPGVYSPGTQDYAYGAAENEQLSANQALNNADTYALYANAVYVGGSCGT